MESAGGRSPQGRATVTVKRQFLHTSNVVSRKLFPAVVMVLMAGWLLPFLVVAVVVLHKDNNQKDEQQRGQGEINLLRGPGAKIDLLEPMCCVLFL